MTELASMPMFWAVFFADTEHLSEDAAKAHLFLIGHAWLRGAKLPDDDAVLSRLCRVGPRKWAAMKASILSLWRKDEGGFWTQKRMSQEYEFVRRKVQVNRENGALGGRRAAEDKSKIHSSRGMKKSVKNGNEINESVEANGSVSVKQSTLTPISQLSKNESSNELSNAEFSEKSPPPKHRDKNRRPVPETPISILESVLSPEIAAGVVEHRKKLRAPLTKLGAKGLAKGFSATGSPDNAARTMVERGWRGFNPEWILNDRPQRSRASPRAPPAKGDATAAAMDLLFGERNREPANYDDGKTIDGDFTTETGDFDPNRRNVARA